MEKSRLISLSKKFSRSIPKLQEPGSVYSELVNTKVYNDFLSILKGEDIALLCFLIPLVKTTEDLSPIYDKILTNLFTFTLIQIDRIEPEIDCPSCNGDGSYECFDCGGDGEERCPECKGDGEDIDGYPCDECQGGGNVKCSSCGGKGGDTCRTCDGNGYINDEDSASILILNYISYDESIYLTFESIESEGAYSTPMSIDMYNKIYENDKTFLMSDDLKNVSDIFDVTKIDEEDIYFASLNKELSLSLSSNNKLEDDNLALF